MTSTPDKPGHTKSLQTIPNKEFTTLMTAVIEKGIPFRFQARGTSMSPFIRSGDIITLAPLHHRPQFGAIVAHINPATDRLAVHRIIARKNSNCLFRGDNSCYSDGWAAQDKIIGRVIRVEHQGHNVRSGLGPERILIAGLSRIGLLRLLILSSYWLRRLILEAHFCPRPGNYKGHKAREGAESESADQAP